MEEHALRRSLSDELHARAFHDFEGAGRFIRYVFLTEAAPAIISPTSDEFLRPTAAAHSRRIKIPAAGDGRFRHRVEQHTEFLSVSFHRKGRKQATGLLGDAFDAATASSAGLGARHSGPVFHAIWLEIGGKAPRGYQAEKIGTMMQSRAIASNLFSEGLRRSISPSTSTMPVFADRAVQRAYLVKPHGPRGPACRRARDLPHAGASRLCGGARARATSAGSSAPSGLTTDLAAQIRQSHGQVQQLLSVLSAQAADLEEIYAKTSYRMAATKAYEAILMDRIASLQLSRLVGFQGIPGFLGRRMTPALDSCRAFAERLSRLSERITRAGDLLQTQTEMIIQRQNRDLLQSMNARARLHEVDIPPPGRKRQGLCQIADKPDAVIGHGRDGEPLDRLLQAQLLAGAG